MIDTFGILSCTFIIVYVLLRSRDIDLSVPWFEEADAPPPDAKDRSGRTDPKSLMKR